MNKKVEAEVKEGTVEHQATHDRSELKDQLMMKDKWIRLFFMVVYAAVFYVLEMIVWALAAVQFIFTLFISKPNDNLLKFSEGLTAFGYHILQYLTYNVEEKPFPFSNWKK